MKNKQKYNVIDEYGRLIDHNVSLKRAKETMRLNPDSQIVESGLGRKGGNDENNAGKTKKANSGNG